MSKKTTTIIALALVACLAVAGISAYFTDGDTATNTFNVGKVSLELQEPNWTEPEDITPQEEIQKDPQIYNDGINDEYVFLEVIVPCANVATADEDGSLIAAQKTELFSWDVNDGWIQVDLEEADDANTYVYAYVGDDDSTMQALAAGETTAALFDYVRFANVTETSGLEDTDLDIVVNAYGIQTDNLNDNDTTIDGVNDDGKVAPADVWLVVETAVDAGAVSTEKA